ncbi:MAG: LytTR family DNA-binding domain-containing protein [Defluviitaleaceae bacterium]|nr:LytTR family DNA-binding domain-containing protein [Defluviitaleaceae bacterium]
MNIAVCEDDAAEAGKICGSLRAYLGRNSYVGDIHTYGSGEELLAAFSPGAFDAVFLDIYMGGMTGMEAAQKMRQADPGFALVFITSRERHALEAFGVRACAYVPKPVTPGAMEAAFAQCQGVFLKNARFIEIVTDRQTVRIPLVNIYYVEVFDKDVIFHTTIGDMKTNMPLEEIDLKLGAAFLRCHRSYLVNMNHIEKIREQDMMMRNGDAAPMRQHGKQKIRGIYGEFLSNCLFETTEG